MVCFDSNKIVGQVSVSLGKQWPRNPEARPRVQSFYIDAESSLASCQDFPARAIHGGATRRCAGIGRYSEAAMLTANGWLRRVGVYCGSSAGNDPSFRAEAEALGELLAATGLTLVYGGANCGLMGAVADAVLAGGGQVIGVLPEVLRGPEFAHRGLTSLEMVGTMHQRKARINELSDALLALPGGHGTLDELMEAITWAQLGLHFKPCILVNTLGYWDGLLRFLDSTVTAGFVRSKDRALLRVAAHAEEALAMAMAASALCPRA